jgi:Protein of unknown function (DUF3987)
MNAHAPPLLEPDRGQIDRFVSLIFSHITDGYISLRAFHANNSVFKIEAVAINGGDMKPICEAAEDIARRAAQVKTETDNVVFCPPVAVFKGARGATQEDLLHGPALSIDFDEHPQRSRAELEAVIGKPTVVVRSGGGWVNPVTGEIEDKLHAHWRLKVPATGAEALAKLKRARGFANAVVGGDTSNDPVNHPLRWPGSWHRKGEPRLCEIIQANPDTEIDLDMVLPLLEAAPKRPSKKKSKTAPDIEDTSGLDGWAQEIASILAGRDLHKSTTVLAAKLIASEMSDGAAVDVLYALMDQSAARESRPLEWMARKKDIPRAVATAREKYAQPSRGLVTPIDLWAKLTPPDLPRALLPPVIERFALEQGRMMGADPAGLVIAALTVCAAAISDRIKLQVKEHDPSWLECARLWGALIGDPSAKKSPMLDIAAYALKRIDGEMARANAAKRAAYDALPSDERKSADPPKKTRVRIEDTTIEAAQEILKDSPDGVLCKRDELSGFFGSMDKYSAGRGAQADRAFWLSAYNGGEYVSDRISRGTCYIPNLSISLLGGIQPGVIRDILRQTVDDGLIQRLIPIALRAATVGKDEPRPDAVKDYNDLVESIYRGSRGGFSGIACDFNEAPEQRVQFTPEGQAVRRRLEQKHVDLMNCEAVNRKLAAHIGKYDGIFARLCLIWHCIEHAKGGRIDPIAGGTAERVAQFLHGFLLPHAVSFYAGDVGLSEDQGHLQELAGYILAHALPELTFREISRCGGSLRLLKRPEMTALLEQFDALGWVTEVPGPRPKSPSRWLVNPECHRLYRDQAARETKRRQEVSETLKEVFAARRAEAHG